MITEIIQAKRPKVLASWKIIGSETEIPSGRIDIAGTKKFTEDYINEHGLQTREEILAADPPHEGIIKYPGEEPTFSAKVSLSQELKDGKGNVIREGGIILYYEPGSVKKITPQSAG